MEAHLCKEETNPHSEAAAKESTRICILLMWDTTSRLFQSFTRHDGHGLRKKSRL